MKISEFNYFLPEELIAQKPADKRSESKLLVLYESGKILHKSFRDIIDFFEKDDVIVLNDTRVFKARVYGHKRTGGKVELLFYKDHFSGKYYALVGGRVGESSIVLINGYEIKIFKDKENLYLVDEPAELVELIMERYGEIPLPPYIKRPVGKDDEERYQTVFSRKHGAVAAPTASLHFDIELLNKLKNKGVNLVYVTLHVGPGTFLPIKTESVEEHKMMPEYCEIPSETAEVINKAVCSKRNVLFCGTTVVRAIEWASEDKEVKPKRGYADLYIYPGYNFKVVRNMLTNFHLPNSTPLVLVCALVGKDLILKAYNEAIERKYRFYSYGDAMLIWKGSY
ncbi:MAG: tRNA preQ1(34) S-adenosylmethionine ribosyltransferase-isomerase QueA [Proteobacteria bacterium]|nr:tRNA preQ1(34) S-adenosylmethionine ribosyltransferase-isomerase QueA [Pseudomonadota bacterium]